MNLTTFSKESQDLFVRAVLANKRNGTWLEIGSSHPWEGSNTYVLQDVFGWSGVGVEWNPELAAFYRGWRGMPCAQADATLLDYESLLLHYHMEKVIDYLQVDVEPAANSLIALLQVLKTGRKFRVITFEHDLYAGGDVERTASRMVLLRAGYVPVVRDVRWAQGPHEDWWVNPDLMPDEAWSTLKAEDICTQKGMVEGTFWRKLADLLARVY